MGAHERICPYCRTAISDNDQKVCWEGVNYRKAHLGCAQRAMGPPPDHHEIVALIAQEIRRREHYEELIESLGAKLEDQRQTRAWPASRRREERLEYLAEMVAATTATIDKYPIRPR